MAIVLCVSSCSTTRSLRSEVRSLTTELRSTEARDSVTIELRDTLREVTTITIDRNDKGDTLFRSVVTDRERVRNAADVRSKTVDVRVVRDTVYVEKRDSVLMERHQTSDISHQTSILKWIFGIILGLIVLIVVIKFLK